MPADLPSTSLPSWGFRISYGPSVDRLNDFYIPALERSVRFDRAAGFFSSAALAIAAAGIVRLIQNGGRMRLLCGAELSREDVEAVRRGDELRGVVEQALVGCLAEPPDQSLRARLEALAWMVASGHLDIKVVLPRGKDGLPLPAVEAREYYHPKEGVFVDAEGNRLAFSGSSNESINSWQWNYEVFSVYATWPLGSGADQAGPLTAYVGQVERRFEDLWNGREESWIALDIPEAARKELLRFCPDTPPDRDPLEKARPSPIPTPSEVGGSSEERLIFEFLREAPFLPGASRIGVATSTVKPWPHQLRVVDEIVARFPESFLLCDEVGLGKTIEAGLAVRQLYVTGKVRRALLLVPKSVLRQWQEELYEKFALNVPRYDGALLLDVFDREVPLSSPIWGASPLLLASSQLAKRRDRQAEVLASGPWDLVLIDEAHHARRRDFLEDRFRPNRLLELLVGSPGRPGLRDRTSAIYLLTATPMQVHPVEIWDLLKVAGLAGRWGALAENFLAYFRELRRSAADRDWDFLFSMLRTSLESPNAIDPDFAAVAERDLGLVEWQVVRGLPWAQHPRSHLQQVSPKARRYVDELLRRHTPIRRHVWRNTRTLLRRYQEKGLLTDKIPHRDPLNEWIALSDGAEGERVLYEQVDEYITDFYKKYEAQRKGLGFVMTVYRRRLTSSFYALRRSLERRLEFLDGQLAHAGLTDDDLEQDDLDLDVSEELADEDRAAFEGERKYVEEFIHDIRELGSDSKLEQLTADLQTIFKKRETVLVFTQYTDTMDYLREQLREVYGSHVACYSGRGGERWDGVAWRSCPKESLKAEFKAGEEIKILLCTESASEGLNLQTCGVLINYDMPWNPMRVEQRIGRIDRIGQRYDRVWIRNYFYRDTVEAVIYQRLSDRIHWFEDVVGGLEPILDRVSRVIEKVAMLPKGQRPKALEAEVTDIKEAVERQKAESLDIEGFLDQQVASSAELPPPLTLQDLERTVLESSLGPLFQPHREIPGAHQLNWRGQDHLVTFSPIAFDAHPNSVVFLTYGTPLLAELLASVGPPASTPEPAGPACFRVASPVRQSLFTAPMDQGFCELDSIQRLRAALEAPVHGWQPGGPERARDLATFAATTHAKRMTERIEREVGQEVEAVRERARAVLVHTALIDIALSRRPDLFEPTGAVDFGSEAVAQLRKEGVPYKALLKILHPEVPEAKPTDAFFEAIESASPEALRKRREALRAEGIETVQSYAHLTTQPATASGTPPIEVRATWYKWPKALALAEPDVAAERTTEAAAPGRALAFLPPSQARPYENCVPFFDLKAAAGAFSRFFASDRPQGEASVDPAEHSWFALPDFVSPTRDLFVTQIVGESLNRRLPNGAVCLFRLDPKGPRNGYIVLAEHRSIDDPDLGGRHTVKVYRSEKREYPDGSWEHLSIELRPDSTDPKYRPIVIDSTSASELRIVAAFVRLLQ